MNPQQKLDELLKLNREMEWVEFKHNNAKPDDIGEYISAIANSAVLHGKRTGYIVWGIEDGTHKIVGTTFKPKQEKKNNEELENWLHHLLSPPTDFTIYEFERESKSVVIFEIQAAHTTPIHFHGVEYIRVGTYKKKLKDHPEKERKLWKILTETRQDWSAGIVEDATLNDLDPDALKFARLQYQEKQKNADFAKDIPLWDDITFLNKAKVCVGGKITRAAILLLGKEESAHFLSPAQAKITWVLKDNKNQEKDYQHLAPPFILASDKILGKIRNLTIRHLPSGTLFPQEVTQYDLWVIRETLHNCIAHQDYSAGGRINVVETPESLLFTNIGSFIPGTVEEMIRSDAPPEIYRNPFLSTAMVNLNMIETIGSGIKKMFLRQRERNFPMPDYELDDPNRVVVKLAGQVLDENYTKLLMGRTDLDLMDVIALDRVQKRRSIDDDVFQHLKKQKLIEGRRPNLFVSAEIAAATGDKASYIKNRAFDNSHYKEMVTSYLHKYGQATRHDLDTLLMEKISDVLDDKQKYNRVRNLLQEMRRDGIIECDSHGPATIWKLAKSADTSADLDHS